MQYQSLVYDNASNSNEQHDMEINSARVAAEEDVANNSKDLFEHFDGLLFKGLRLQKVICSTELQRRGNALEECTWFKIQDSRRMYLVQVGSRTDGSKLQLQ
ncbi:hypothetical protein HN51_028184 [Arachis hypogaea]